MKKKIRTSILRRQGNFASQVRLRVRRPSATQFNLKVPSPEPPWVNCDKLGLVKYKVFVAVSELGVVWQGYAIREQGRRLGKKTGHNQNVLIKILLPPGLPKTLRVV